MGAGLELFAGGKDGSEFPVGNQPEPLMTEDGVWGFSSSNPRYQQKKSCWKSRFAS
jgi:hypothetical protein